jgi:integrase
MNEQGRRQEPVRPRLDHQSDPQPLEQAGLQADPQPDTPPVGPAGPAEKIPGCLWKHPKTGGWYWKVSSLLMPAEIRRAGKTCNLPLVPNGRKTATKVRAVAEACRLRLWRQWSAQLAGRPPRGIQKWLEEFRDWNAHHAQPQHADNNLSQLRRFVAAEGIARPADLSDEAVLRFLSRLRDGGPDGKPAPAAERTVIRYRNTIHKFCRYLYRRGEIERNPADLVEVRQPVKLPPRFLTDEQMEMFLRRIASAETWLADASRFALYAGLRLSELMKLRWGDVRQDSIVTGGKSRNYRIVPIIRQLEEAVAQMKRGGADVPVFPPRAKRDWSQLFADMTDGLPLFGELPGRRAGNRWHLLRATYAVNHARGAWTGEPATVWQLMAWMGHTTPLTTMRYVNIAQAAERVRPRAKNAAGEASPSPPRPAEPGSQAPGPTGAPGRRRSAGR